MTEIETDSGLVIVSWKATKKGFDLVTQTDSLMVTPMEIQKVKLKDSHWEILKQKATKKDFRKETQIVIQKVIQMATGMEIHLDFRKEIH